MKILGFYISRTDWEYNHMMAQNTIEVLECELSDLRKKYNSLTNKQFETYTDKSGRLRYKHNGQFAPDNRSKFKQMHDRLRAEQTPHWDDIKQAMKQEEFGR